MVRLLLDLLARRSEGRPVPVLASIASWNPADQKLYDWLASQLVTDYPVLALLTGMTGDALAAALLAAGLILLILDGLDEIPDQARGLAITQINDALRPGQPLVVTCRSQ
jgi:predicted NACHT family NTPase